MLLCSCCFTDREKQYGLLVLSYNRMRINILLQFKKKHRKLKLIVKTIARIVLDQGQTGHWEHREFSRWAAVQCGPSHCVNLNK